MRSPCICVHAMDAHLISSSFVFSIPQIEEKLRGPPGSYVHLIITPPTAPASPTGGRSFSGSSQGGGQEGNVALGQEEDVRLIRNAQGSVGLVFFAETR